MDTITPSSYHINWDPIPEQTLDASSWFENEYIEVRVEEGEKGMIAYYQAQGWVAYNVYASSVHIGGGDSGVTAWTYRMKRRKLQSERVLQDMIGEFTSAYNEGRSLNDRRYDEIVSVYDRLVDETQDEIQKADTDVAQYETIIDGIIDGLPTLADDYETTVDGLLDDYGESQRDRINTQFDNQISEARQNLVSKGMYNTTTWNAVEAGIERERAKALTDFEDNLIERKLVTEDRIVNIKLDLKTRLEGAASRLSEMKRRHQYDGTEIRNRIITALLAFQERRTDDYPGIGQLANIASQLGYSEGGTVSPPS